MAGEIPKIRTMRSDAEELIREKQVSKLDIAAKQYMAQTRPGGRPVGRWLKTTLISIVVLAGVGVVGYFAYTNLAGLFWGEEEEKEAKAPPAFFSVDDESVISFKEVFPGEFISKINEERKRPLRFDTIVYYPVEIEPKIGEKKFTDADTLTRILSWGVGSTLADAIAPEFNILVAHTPADRSFAVMFKVRDFGRALGALIEWEQTMGHDFKPFFGEDAEDLNNFSFRDEIIKNNDARVLKDSESGSAGRAILAYSIFDKRFLIISTSREGLGLILDRLIKLPPR